MKIYQRRIIPRRSPLQKAIQQNARKTANCLRGYRTEVLKNISAIKVWTELYPELRPELARQIPAHGDANLPAELRNYGASSDRGSENPSRGVFSTKSGVETGKMNTATRRNRFCAKRRPERMKRRRFRLKSGSTLLFMRLRRSESIDGRFRLSFRRLRLPTDAYFSL